MARAFFLFFYFLNFLFLIFEREKFLPVISNFLKFLLKFLFFAREKNLHFYTFFQGLKLVLGKVGYFSRFWHFFRGLKFFISWGPNLRSDLGNFLIFIFNGFTDLRHFLTKLSQGCEFRFVFWQALGGKFYGSFALLG